MYAVSSVPLISSLQDDVGNGNTKQVWYADDASACGKFSSLREWFEKVNELGPLYGYYPEPSKSYLVVKEQCLSEAEMIFEDSGVNVVTSHWLVVRRNCWK